MTTLDARALRNKVPQITILFWVVKMLSTTVGETAADYLNGALGWGLTGTTLAVAAVFVVLLIAQFATRRYVPAVYWATVVLISVVGTLFSDNLVDNLGVPLWVTTAIFSVCLAATFVTWFASERTLSIHTIVTRRREAFYWLAILFTFALGTSAGDLISEGLGLGYLVALLVFAGLIAIVALAHYRFGLGAVVSFWIAYVLTRPLGASIGDLVSQAPADGGLGWGTTGTSIVFLVIIVAAVVWFTVRERREATAGDLQPA